LCYAELTYVFLIAQAIQLCSYIIYSYFQRYMIYDMPVVCQRLFVAHDCPLAFDARTYL
jgi:hypothetical protein